MFFHKIHLILSGWWQKSEMDILKITRGKWEHVWGNWPFKIRAKWNTNWYSDVILTTSCFPSPSQPSVGNLLLHLISLSSLLLSSLLSAACCTVWVSLWGLHTVCMCLGWQTGLTHLPNAFIPLLLRSHYPSLTCCTFVCISITPLRLACMSILFVCPSHFPSFCFSL